MTDFIAADISIANGSVSNFSGSGAIYTFDVTPLADGAVVINVPPNVADDAAGNGNTAAPTLTVSADITRPTTTIDGPTDTQTSGFRVDIDFSESVSGFELGDIQVSNGAASGLAGSGANYSVTITPAADGTVTVDVAAAVAQDAAGNDNQAAAQFSVLADISGPTATIGGPMGTQTGAFNVDIDFSESVSGFDLGDIQVGNGAASNFSGSGASYSVTITPSADGTVTVDVGASVATDSIGNGNAAAPQFSVLAEVTGPTTTLSGPSATQTGAFTVDIDFSESVTGFELGDIQVGNGTLSNFAGSGASYSITITPDADGPVTVDVAAGVAVNSSAIGNEAALQFSVIADIPGITSTIDFPGTPQSGPFAVDIRFGEPVTDFQLNDISVANGAASNLSGSGANYSFTITPTGDGDIDVTIPAGAVVNGGGNSNDEIRFSVRFFDSLSETTRQIAAFSYRRAKLILQSEPNWRGVLRRLSPEGEQAVGPVSLFADYDGQRWSQLAFATSGGRLRQVGAGGDRLSLSTLDDIWVEASFSQYADTSASGLDIDGTYFVAHAGADISLGAGVILGGMITFDHMDEEAEAGGGTTEGTGFLVGPYIAAQVLDSVLFNGRAAWGIAQNTINPIGKFSDEVENTRWLLRGELVGETFLPTRFGVVRISPDVSASYYSEKFDGYIDGVGATIPTVTVSRAAMQFGGEARINLETGTDAIVSPYGAIHGVWDFSDAEGGASGLETPSGSNLSAATRLGVDLISGNLELGASGGWSGLGASDFDAVSARFELRYHF